MVCKIPSSSNQSNPYENDPSTFILINPTKRVYQIYPDLTLQTLQEIFTSAKALTETPILGAPAPQAPFVHQNDPCWLTH